MNKGKKECVKEVKKARVGWTVRESSKTQGNCPITPSISIHTGAFKGRALTFICWLNLVLLVCHCRVLGENRFISCCMYLRKRERCLSIERIQ
jgi:hypothetical protein